MDFKELETTMEFVPGELYADTCKGFLSVHDTILRCHSVDDQSVYFDNIEWDGTAGYQKNDKGFYKFPKLTSGLWLHVKKIE